MTNNVGRDIGEAAHQKAFLKKFKFSTTPQLIINLSTQHYREEPGEQAYVL